MYRIGVDIGGTFTDVVLIDSNTGYNAVTKVSSTPAKPEIGVIRGIRELLQQVGADGSEIEHLVHGTTIVSNTLIEGTGARTGLVTTKGFRDVLEARNGKRYDLYDMSAVLPSPLVPRYLRATVPERIDNTGAVLIPLDEVCARDVLEQLVEQGIESLAVCFLHSFRNDVHERRIRALMDEIALTIPVSLSVDVSPQVREYPRVSTTVINAYVRPKVAGYLSNLERELCTLGFERPFYMMFSGAAITSRVARQIPVRIAESGPAGGAIAAAHLGERLGLERLISFDMGGTTAKICFIDDGAPTVTRDFEIARVHRFRKGSGYPIALPALDMIEIGAGGGSIVWIDSMGLLKVGPQSAGAEPGPVCYGRGGHEPTVTDANLLLGYLSSTYFLGGHMPLDVDEASDAIARSIAAPLDMDVTGAAAGIFRVVNENMANAARVYAAEKGRDVRDYTLVAFGGAGPVHATALAHLLGVSTVVIPSAAGVMSAIGLLAAPLAFDFVHSYVTPLRTVDLNRINELLADMEARGREILREAGVAAAGVTVTRSADMRYVGQVHEINVPIPAGTLNDDDVAEMQHTYDAEYERIHRRANLGYEVECLNWRVTVSGPRPSVSLSSYASSGDRRIRDALKGYRPVYVPDAHALRDCPVYDRYKLFSGAAFDGPAIIEEQESTTVVGAESRVSVDKFGNLVIRRTMHA